MKKTLTIILAFVLVIAMSVAGTVAYLTSQDTVTNTFTVGKVAITLDEAPVDADGQATSGARVTTNSYKLIPGHEYDKDPIVHFQANSEASWLFVKVENNIAGAESTAASYKSIATQITDNGWTVLDGVAGVYYKRVNASGANAVDYPVFAGFTVKDDITATGLADYANKTIVVTAYAIQADGFVTAGEAWTAGGFGA